MSQQYWLMKSEPHVYSIEHLEKEGTSIWDGIRNYQARNFMRTMNVGDVAFFYHSNCPQPGIYGKMKVSGSPYPDPTALDRKSEYFFAKATKENNPWTSVDVDFVEKFTTPLLLNALKELPLGECPLTARGNRLSVMPITSAQYELISSELNKLNGGDEESEEQKEVKTKKKLRDEDVKKEGSNKRKRTK